MLQKKFYELNEKWFLKLSEIFQNGILPLFFIIFFFSFFLSSSIIIFMLFLFIIFNICNFLSFFTYSSLFLKSKSISSTSLFFSISWFISCFNCIIIFDQWGFLEFIEILGYDCFTNYIFKFFQNFIQWNIIF